MGVLDTTYTFTATDIVTSAKLNNVIDQTTFTSSAIATGNVTLAVTASGQLKVNTSGIGANELADNSVTTAKILDANVTTAKILDANVTQAKLASNTVGNGPAFRAYATTDTSIGNQVHTQVNLVTELFDTNSNFANSRFTPTVAGYYLISGQIFTTVANTGLLASIAKNNVQYALGTQISASSLRSTVSDIVYLNGTGDYVALNAYSGGAVTIQNSSGIDTYFSGCLIRSA